MSSTTHRQRYSLLLGLVLRAIALVYVVHERSVASLFTVHAHAFVTTPPLCLAIDGMLAMVAYERAYYSQTRLVPVVLHVAFTLRTFVDMLSQCQATLNV